MSFGYTFSSLKLPSVTLTVTVILTITLLFTTRPTYAQTQTPALPLTIIGGPGPVQTDTLTSTRVNSFPPTITTCFVTPTDSRGEKSTIAFNPNGPLPSGAECYEIIRSSGRIIESVLFTAGVSASSSSAPAPRTSSKLGTVLGAVAGGVLGVILLVGMIFWYRRSRTRDANASGNVVGGGTSTIAGRMKPRGGSRRPGRVQAWMDRNGGRAWVQEEKMPATHVEMKRQSV